MKSIPKSLQSTPRQTFQFVEEGDLSPGQSSSFDEDYQTSRAEVVMEDFLPDQNQSMEIQVFPRRLNDSFCEKQFKRSSGSRRLSVPKRRRPFSAERKKTDDQNFQFFLKILISILIVCVLVGMFAAIVENNLKNQRSIPSGSPGVGDTFMALYNNRNNKLNTNQVTTENNLKNEQTGTTSMKQLIQRPLNSQTSGNQNAQTVPIGNLVRNPKNSVQIPSVAPKPESHNTIPEPECSKSILQERSKYGPLYQFSVNRDIFRSNSNVNYFVERTPTQISKEKFVQAFDLLQAIHKVDEKGNIIAQDAPCESGEVFSTRLKEAIKKNTDRLNRQYNMDTYSHSQLRFCIVSNSYRNAQNGLFYRNIDSILQQNYTNYHVVYTDDNSPDQTGQKVKKYLSEKNISQDKIKVKINQKKVGMMENIYNAITYDCQDGEIAVMLDGDDSFIGTNVLSMLNAVYQKKRVALMWNNFLQINENSRGMIGFSRALNDFGSNFKSYRIQRRFVSTHLKSFYVDLFKKIKVSDLQDNAGNFYGGASDTAMMMPMLEMSYPHFEYVPEIVYEYRFDTGQVGMTVNRGPQAVALAKIGLTEPYKSLTDFSFVDQAISKAQKIIQQKPQQTK